VFRRGLHHEPYAVNNILNAVTNRRTMNVEYCVLINASANLLVQSPSLGCIMCILLWLCIYRPSFPSSNFVSQTFCLSAGVSVQREDPELSRVGTELRANWRGLAFVGSSATCLRRLRGVENDICRNAHANKSPLFGGTSIHSSR
jgi:hypothetical protein